MATLQERLQMKRVPIDKWSVKEQLCLASAVSRSGDQNWVSVSRALKPFAEANRPPDWFSQKNCAAQYGLLLENVETPKRKKRVSGSGVSGGPDSGNIETPQEVILKRLTEARKGELRKKIEEEKREYLKLQEEMELLRSGAATDEMIEKWSKEIEEEEIQKSQDAVTHAQWLKQREERKLELERVFRPVKSSSPSVPQGQKRKASSESIDTAPLIEVEEAQANIPSEPSKPAMSPLLTSLLKTPSHAPNPVTSSILHSAITNTQRGTSPTIASLLNNSNTVPVSQSLQQLVTTAIAQEPTEEKPTIFLKLEEPLTTIITTTTITTTSSTINTTTEDAKIEIPTEKIKQEITANTTGPTADETDIDERVIDDKVEEKEECLEIKQEDIPTEETDVINKDEILELEKDIEKPPELKEIIKEEIVAEPIKVENKITNQLLDVYDFDTSSQTSNDTEIEPLSSAKDVPESTSEVSTDSNISNSTNTNSNNEDNDNIAVPAIQEDEQPNPQIILTPVVVKALVDEENDVNVVEEEKNAVVEDEDSDKEMNKKVSEIQKEIRDQEIIVKTDVDGGDNDSAIEKDEDVKKTTVYDEYDFDELKKPEILVTIPEQIVDKNNSETQELADNIYDDLVIEVTKLDKSGKAKRDYSRMRKKDEKEGLDILLAVEKTLESLEDGGEGMEETGSEKDSQDSEDKKSESGKLKLLIAKDTDRSNSPWTEEEVEILPKNRRRLSTTPATPSDSVPNSPASGIGIFDDDRDYRTWKKSVMLVYNRLVTHKCASLFLKPITDEQAPGYHDMVYRPMDLQTIRKNIESGSIRSTAEFQRDVLLMFNNAIMYNSKNEMVYQMAQHMQQEGLQQIQILMQAQAQVELPVRRETRTSESGLKRKRQQEEHPLPKIKKRRDE